MSDNPLMEKIRIPGGTYRLPSRGLFYTPGVELDESVESGELVINPMRTTEELLLNNTDKLFTGDAAVEVFKYCIPAIKDTRELLSKDVDYLLMCLRIVSYGPTMELSYTHTCEDAEQHDYNINLEELMGNVKEIDPTTLDQKFRMQLPNGQVLKLRPPRYDRVIKLYQSFGNFEEDISDEVMKENIIANLTDMIERVDDVNDPEHISEWLDNLPAGFVANINNFVEACSDWGMEYTTKITCQDCGEEIEINVPSNPISFFT